MLTTKTLSDRLLSKTANQQKNYKICWLEKSIYNDPNIAQYIAHENRVPPISASVVSRKIGIALTDRFFGFLSRKPTAYLERAPAFKQRYYSWG
jgi:hypothetical protein